MTDVTISDAGNSERLAFIFDNKRVQPSGLAGEIVIPPKWVPETDPRLVIHKTVCMNPSDISFKAEKETFILATSSHTQK